MESDEIDAALDVLRAAGWDVRSVEARGRLIDVGDLAPGGIVELTYGGPEHKGYRHVVVTQPWCEATE